MRRIFLAVVIVLAVLAPLRSERSARAETITLNPAHDAFVNSSAPDSTYGASGLLQLRGGDDTVIESYLQFHVAGLPGPVEQAVLRLHVHDPGTTPTEVLLAGNDWSETSVTWATRPPVIAGVAAGGEGAPAGAWVELDLTSVITGDGVYSLALLTEGDDQIDYLSKDSAQATGRPELVLTYQTALPTEPAAETATETATEAPPPVPSEAPTETAADTPTAPVTPEATGAGTPAPRASETPAASPATPTGASALTSASTGTPELLLSATRGQVYSPLRVHVRHFAPDTRVAIAFAGARVLTVTTNEDGSARGSFAVPRAPAGVHSVRADAGQDAASARFRVLSSVTLSPATVEAGETVTLTVRGFGAGATVTIRLYGLGSTTRYAELGRVQTSSTGTGQAVLRVGVGTRAGPHALRAVQGDNADDATLNVARPPDRSFTFSAVGDLMTSTRVGGVPYTRADAACRLAGREELFLALGDVQYQNGAYDLFMSRYDVSACGDIKSKTRPVPGNHEYDTSGAAGYFRYFGDLAGDPTTGYYSFDMGGVHFVAVNSNCSFIPGGCGTTGAQYRFIANDLATNSERCTVMYSHHPRYGSGLHGNNGMMDPIWDLFADGGGDIVLSGHDHTYERFAPMDADGDADPEGARQFVVGTGGVSYHSFETTEPNSQVRIANATGVLRVTVSGATYSWQLVSIDGAVLDSGSDECH